MPETAASISPFFIVGCGRSGTTLLRVMLNHHPELAVPPEALSLIDLLRAPKLTAEQARRELLRDYEIGRWQVPLEAERFADCETVAAVIARVHELYAEARGKRAWGHKTPRMVRYAELLESAFEGVRFVHVVRDPRAVARSFTRSQVHRSNALYAARRWRRDVAAGGELARRLPDRAIELRYEDLVREPEAQLRRVCDFLGVGFDPAVLEYADDATREYGEYHRQAHAKLASRPDPDRIDLWRRSLTPRQLRVIETIAGPLMRPYGYEPVAPRPAGGVDLLAHRVDRLPRLAGQIAFSLRKRSGFLPGYVMRKIRLGLYRDLLEFNF